MSAAAAAARCCCCCYCCCSHPLDRRRRRRRSHGRRSPAAQSHDDDDGLFKVVLVFARFCAARVVGCIVVVFFSRKVPNPKCFNNKTLNLLFCSLVFPLKTFSIVFVVTVVVHKKSSSSGRGRRRRRRRKRGETLFLPSFFPTPRIALPLRFETT